MVWLAVVLVVVLLVVVLLWMVGSYNGMVALREQVRAGWAQIDTMLKRRHDLIPNLVETVKGYAAHEKDTLERVIAARNQAAAVGGNPVAAAAAEGALSGALRQLFALAESYPQLKANENFSALQKELAETENRIATQRQQYNSLVAAYNATILRIPNNLVAGPFGFAPMAFWEMEDTAQREAPQVKF